MSQGTAAHSPQNQGVGWGRALTESFPQSSMALPSTTRLVTCLRRAPSWNSSQSRLARRPWQAARSSSSSASSAATSAVPRNRCSAGAQEGVLSSPLSAPNSLLSLSGPPGSDGAIFLALSFHSSWTRKGSRTLGFCGPIRQGRAIVADCHHRPQFLTSSCIHVLCYVILQ